LDSLPQTESIICADVTIWWQGPDGRNEFGPVEGACPLRDAKYGKLDDDAPKKAMTDALTKGLSHLGFNADVFLNKHKWGDNKYVGRDEAPAKPASQRRQPAPQRSERPASTGTSGGDRYFKILDQPVPGDFWDDRDGYKKLGYVAVPKKDDAGELVLDDRGKKIWLLAETCPHPEVTDAPARDRRPAPADAVQSLLDLYAEKGYAPRQVCNLVQRNTPDELTAKNLAQLRIEYDDTPDISDPRMEDMESWADEAFPAE
jgi:hypothetical protein